MTKEKLAMSMARVAAIRLMGESSVLSVNYYAA
jgi:hypothetical protein